jgi:spore coat protein U-like protein
MKHIFQTLFFFLSFMAFNEAKAQSCVVSTSPVNFGNVNTVTGALVDTTATMQVTCIGTPGQTVRMCISLGSGSGGTTTGNPRTMTSGVNNLNYSLYTNSALNTIWGSNIWPFTASYPAYRTLIPIPLAGSVVQNVTIYARVLAGQTATASGAYSSNFGGHTLINYDYNFLTPCSTLPTPSTTTSFTVSASVGTNCQVSATDMNFGSVGLLTTNADSTSTISALCTPGVPYTIALSNGVTGLAPLARKMTQGVNAVTYGLYRDAARSQAWGQTTGIDTLAGSGSGALQNITVYGRIPTQTTPPPGSYSDTINVTLTY